MKPSHTGRVEVAYVDAFGAAWYVATLTGPNGGLWRSGASPDYEAVRTVLDSRVAKHRYPRGYSFVGTDRPLT